MRSLNETLPKGVAPPAAPATVAVKVTAWPKLLGFGEDASEVLLGATTDCTSPALDPPLKLVSPPRCAVT